MPRSRLTRLHGVVPPLVTPLTVAGDIDRVTLRRLVDRFIDAGVHGLFVLGSTGEGAFLTDAQRSAVVSTAAEAAAGRVPVLAGAPDTASDRVIAQARAAIAAGADSIVVTAPLYGHASVAEIAGHFTHVAEAVDMPVVAYDNPDVVHNRLDTDMLIALAYEGVVAAVKDSSGDLTALRRLRAATSDIEGFSIFTGSETLTDVALWLGADGVVPGLGNVDIDGYVRLCRFASEGDWEAARDEQARLIRLFDIVSVADRDRVGRLGAGVGAFKEAMRNQGLLTSSRLSPPFAPLDPSESAQVARILAEAGPLSS